MKKVVATILLILFLFPTIVQAQDPNDPTVGCPGGHINTAIGCIPANSESALATFILSWGLGIASGIALLLIGYGGIQIMSAGGNPQKIQAGKELITAAIAGLALIIFSAYILRVLGVEILGISQLTV